MERMPYTIALAGAAILLSVAFALPIGIVAAMQRGTSTTDWSCWPR